MSTEVHNLVARLKAMGATQAARELEKFSGAVKGGTKSLSQMQLIGGITAGMLATDLARGFMRAAKEGVVMAAQFQTAQTGFERLTARFDEGVISLETLRTVTKGTVNDLNLLQTANKAVALGLPVERMNELFDIASKLGPLMGRTVTEAVNDLALGIGRQSRMILDNLGIVISAEEAYEEYARTIGKVASELSKAEKDQAFLNAALAEGKTVVDQVGDAMSDMQEALLQAEAGWDNLKIAIGEATGPGIVGLSRLADALAKNMAGAREHRQALIDLYTGIPSGWIVALEESAKAAEAAARAAKVTEHAFASLSDTLREDFVTAVDEASDAIKDQVDDIGKQLTAIDDLQRELEDFFRVRREEEFLKPLEDALDASRRESSELNLELMKLTRNLDLGNISQEKYDEEAQRIRGTLADLRIRQEELRLAIDDTTAAIIAQGQAFAGLAPPLEDIWKGGAGADPFSFDYTQYAPLATGVAGAGGQQFQVMAIGGQRGAATTTTITINLTGEQIAGKTAAEIRELARKLADEMIKELRRMGVTP